jgi:hypothetical protein
MAAPTIAPAPVRARPLARAFDQRVQRLRQASATTPGRFGGIGVGLLLLIVLTGLLTVVGVAQRASAVDHLVGQSEPRASAAQQLYGALSDADATASRAFLSGGLEPTDVRRRYDDAIARAETALAVAARGASQGSAAQVTEVATQLPVYVGLVETARANNRQGFPVGAAYLREASSLMRDRLLPAASEVYRVESQNQAADVDAADDFPVIELLLALIVLGGLLAAQLYLTRRTNRVFNVGLLVASGAVALWLLWSMIAVTSQLNNLEDSTRRGSAQMQVLAQARIAVTEARADETLTLVARGDGKAYQDHYLQVIGELGDADNGLLGTARTLATDDAVRDRVNAAIQQADGWRQVHDRVRQLDDGGQYREAVDLAISPDEGSAGSAFGRLEGELAQAFTLTEQAFNAEARSARNALTGLAGGVAALAVIAAAGAGWGVWQRLREYW